MDRCTDCDLTATEAEALISCEVCNMPLCAECDDGDGTCYNCTWCTQCGCFNKFNYMYTRCDGSDEVVLQRWEGRNSLCARCNKAYCTACMRADNRCYDCTTTGCDACKAGPPHLGDCPLCSGNLCARCCEDRKMRCACCGERRMHDAECRWCARDGSGNGGQCAECCNRCDQCCRPIDPDTMPVDGHSNPKQSRVCGQCRLQYCEFTY
jgi:hypothetical protein